MYESILYKLERNYAIMMYKYQIILKIKEAEKLLKRTKLPIKKIAEITGFSNQLHFCNTYKKHMGKSPSEARKNFEN